MAGAAVFLMILQFCGDAGGGLHVVEHQLDIGSQAAAAGDLVCERYLLDKGKDCNKSMYEIICATENRLVEGFTEEEKEQFFGYLNRAIANMGCSSCNPKHKEETQA